MLRCNRQYKIISHASAVLRLAVSRTGNPIIYYGYDKIPTTVESNQYSPLSNLIRLFCRREDPGSITQESIRLPLGAKSILANFDVMIDDCSLLDAISGFMLF